MKTLPCCILLLLALTVSAEARTWTAKTGQTMNGEYVKLDGENVLIKLTNGKRAIIKLDLLSDEDRQFVQEAEDPFEIVEPAEKTTTPQPPSNNGATAQAENTGATISVDKTIFEPGEKIAIRYSGFTKDLFKYSYPTIEIYDEKIPAICDSKAFLDFISQGKENVPSSGTVELKLPGRPGTYEVRLNFYSEEHQKRIYAVIPITVKNYPPPSQSIVGTWSLASGINFVIVVTLEFKSDGTYSQTVLTESYGTYRGTCFRGNYSAKDGVYTITNLEVRSGTRKDSRLPNGEYLWNWTDDWHAPPEPTQVHYYVVGTDEYGKYLVHDQEESKIKNEDTAKWRKRE